VRAPSRSRRVEVELVAADADQPDVEDEVRVGAGGELPTSAGWLATVAASISAFSNRSGRPGAR
jgi:hypothetical protein